MTGTIYTAARLHAFNPRGDNGTALLVQGGRILDVAPLAALRQRAPGAEVIDFGAATITPGLTDSHIHLTEWAVARSQVDLANAQTPEAAASAVAGVVVRAGGAWVLGRGWNAHHWGGSYPSRAPLDAIAPTTPVVLQSHDMHALWLNSRALELAGIDRLTDDPPGGRILREKSGVPTGILLENAAQLVVPRLPRHDVNSLLPLVRAAQAELHSYGITAIHSFPGVHLLEPDPFEVLQELRRRGELKLRILQHIALEKLDSAIRLGLRSGFGDEWIRTGGVKMFLDGALGSRTAWLREPYEGTTDVGVQVMDGAEFRAVVEKASRHGIASVVHAIGDAAVARAFEVLVQDAEGWAHSATLALPHRVEHVQCLPPDCAPWLSKRVVCSVQPSHLMTDWQAADAHWGARARNTYAFRYMLDNGATLACGSDAPVEGADPRHGMYAAVTRQDLAGNPAGGWHAEQRISAREVLAGYTTGPAYVAGIPATQAGLAPGALADFVAWAQDPLAVAPDHLLELRPVATVVAGEMVYRT